MKSNITYYLSRVKTLGLTGLYYNLSYRMRKKLFTHKYKRKALNKRAGTHEIKDFARVFEKLKRVSFFDKILSSERFKTLMPKKYTCEKTLEQEAQDVMALRFDILGSGKISFDKHEIPWHDDIKTRNLKKIGFSRLERNYLGERASRVFYCDIVIGAHETHKEQEQEKETICDTGDTHDTCARAYTSDIKVPWELSRLQYLFTLGQAYSVQNKKSKRESTLMQEQACTYERFFQDYLQDWLDQNPYLLGPNWVCPMDVAIRAINLLWGFYFFKDAQSIAQEFWQKLTCSLYDHMIYLEYNWEWSDKPNNHYLSDLLGYFYLTSFLGETKKRDWVLTKLHEQFDKQIHKDGTSYEGSSAYHMLDTEIYLHTLELSKAQDLHVPDGAEERLNVMLDFLRACSVCLDNSVCEKKSTRGLGVSGAFVQIGDNDSGKIVTGICVACEKNARSKESLKMCVSTYKNFGLTIIKKPDFHVTFRHPVFKQAQPSGHFHNDNLSVTLALNGQPILVDSGSYVYTASAYWRNYFRGYASHNSFYPESFYAGVQEKTNDLFQCARIEHALKNSSCVTCNNSNSFNNLRAEVHDTSCVYRDKDIHAKRTVICDYDKRLVTLRDAYVCACHVCVSKKMGLCSHNMIDHIDSMWSLNFHPDIVLKKVGRYWEIERDNQELCLLRSDLNFKLFDSFYSPAYGVREKAYRLVARERVALGSDGEFVTKIIF